MAVPRKPLVGNDERRIATRVSKLTAQQDRRHCAFFAEGYREPRGREALDSQAMSVDGEASTCLLGARYS